MVKKMVGNACRTKSQIRSSKSKGRTFERDAEASLQTVYPDTYMTHEKGYIQEYDLRSDNAKCVFECKRIAGISWNQLEKLYIKLKSVAPQGYSCFILFQSNHQPCLVFGIDTMYSRYHIVTFFDEWGQNFIKHNPVKKVFSKIADDFVEEKDELNKNIENT